MPQNLHLAPEMRLLQRNIACMAERGQGRAYGPAHSAKVRQ